ncbi:uncharacterized protein LOC129317789 [Prosopis cineraria]|uniref:uncharacterized protein LOC129317789 n=1 Tax=Prosopis cineraria TaxID=364024 RepID=UPI0024108A17|nr:uncharacterized protein LOC129317789 [Prosopis cineraria]XP_054818145.1 uncharacterized protein LOC129317789 [Prosopis cineraria]
MKDLILRANFLWLENCQWDHKDLSLKIKHLEISSCPEKRFIVNISELNSLQTKHVFSYLITLKLREMNCLEQVFQDSSNSFSLPMLQELCIAWCPELRTCIFTHTTVTSLPKLRKLNIRYCKKVKWLFPYSRVCHCPSLEKWRIHDCSELERPIGGDGDEDIAHDDQSQRQGESLYDMQDFLHGNESERVQCFNQLPDQKPLTPFLNLKRVKISLCERMKGIFEVQVREAQDPNLRLNSELCKLRLQELPELEYIWKGPTQIVSLHRLEVVLLDVCPRLKSVFSLAILTSFLELRTLEVVNCKEWERLFCEESLKNLSYNVCFPKLKAILINYCNTVKRLFSYSLASLCPPLEVLNIKDWCELDMLVDGDSDEEAAIGDQLPLLQLEQLYLVDLPKLREIFRGEFEYKLESLHDLHKNENTRVGAVDSELCLMELRRLPELEFIWNVPTQIISLHRLEQVRLVSCSRLKSIFTLATISILPELRTLEVR